MMFGTPFQPFPQGQPVFPGTMNGYAAPQQSANILPPQQILQANGKASIDALRMSPNSSALIMDTTAPVVWLCVSDSLGNVTPTAYDITPHKDAPEVDTRTLEARVARLEEILHGKSNATTTQASPAANGAEPG